MEKFVISRKSHTYNEDFYILKDNFCLVGDGATSLVPTEYKPTFGNVFVKFIKKKLLKVKKVDDDILSWISKAFAFQYNLSEKELSNPSYLPTCGLVYCNFSSDLKHYEFAYIGDVHLVLKLKNGEYKVYQQQELVSLDNKAIEAMKQYSKSHSVSFLDARKSLNDVLIENRNLANKENGYPVYSPSKTGSFKFSYGIIEKEEVSSIYMFTDGFAQAFDTLNIFSSLEMCLDSIHSKEDAQKVILEIKNRSYKDKDCNKYPRFKTIDDITFLMVKF